MATTLVIKIETINEDGDNQYEIECYIENSKTTNVGWEFTLAVEDYPDDTSIEAYISGFLAEQCFVWDEVSVIRE